MLGKVWKAHNSNPQQNNFINGIQVHNQSPWFNPMVIYLSKSPILIGNIWNPIFYWQHQSPIFIGNIKSLVPIGNIKRPIFIGNIKSPSSRWRYPKPIFSLALFYKKKPEIIKHLAKRKVSWHNYCLSITMAKNHDNHFIKAHMELSWRICSHIITHETHGHHLHHNIHNIYLQRSWKMLDPTSLLFKLWCDY